MAGIQAERAQEKEADLGEHCYLISCTFNIDTACVEVK